MYSDDWDSSNIGICYHSKFTAITRSIGVCRHHRFDEDDKGFAGKNLRLNLKAKWYDLIEEGIKKTEYREIKPYWFKRLTITTSFGSVLCRRFDTVTFVYGYTKRQMTFVCKSIDRGQGKPEWGAEEGKKYFRIHIGQRLED